jgi:nicotinamidase-related amidase
MGGPTAVLLIDVINDFSFEGAERLIRAAHRASRRIEVLSRRAREARVPVIYVNDNFGRWRSDFATTIAQCTKPELPGRRICQRLHPQSGDYFILKPQHSAFFSTPLELLLEHLHVHTLVMTGFAANLCVVFTANDAHMRGYRLVVPSDCTASNAPALTRGALAHIETALNGDVGVSSRIDFDELARQRRKPRDQRF